MSILYDISNNSVCCSIGQLYYLLFCFDYLNMHLIDHTAKLLNLQQFSRLSWSLFIDIVYKYTFSM